MRKIEAWEYSDSFECWRLAIQHMREAGLKEWRYEPANDEERKIQDSARREVKAK